VPARARQSQNVPVSYPRRIEFPPVRATQYANLQGSSYLTDSNRRPEGCINSVRDTKTSNLQREPTLRTPHVETGRAFFAANSRARIAGTTEGLVKLVFRASDRRLLGAHILGEEASELIHVAQAMLHARATVREFIEATFNVPTRADAYKYAAYDALQHLEARVRSKARVGTHKNSGDTVAGRTVEPVSHMDRAAA
jgi:Pyridine nucleotide-disulphide oxidoreductase, dimerisation domain